MMATESKNLKEIIAFPTLKPKFDQKEEKYDYRSKKIVGILSNGLSAGLASNALGHLAFSAGHYADDSWMGRKIHTDAKGQEHTGISRYPFVVLGANEDQIKQIVEKVNEIPEVSLVDYPQEMFDTGHDDELSKAISKAKKMTYHAVVLVGPSKSIDKLTKDLQLYGKKNKTNK